MSDEDERVPLHSFGPHDVLWATCTWSAHRAAGYLECHQTVRVTPHSPFSWKAQAEIHHLTDGDGCRIDDSDHAFIADVRTDVRRHP